MNEFLFNHVVIQLDCNDVIIKLRLRLVDHMAYENLSHIGLYVKFFILLGENFVYSGVI